MQSDEPKLSKTRATDRIITPVSGLLRRAAVLSVIGGALWPVQAAVIAWAIASWVTGGPVWEPALIAAGAFIALAVLRAGLDHRAGALLFDAADRSIARERQAVIAHEAQARSNWGSPAIASLLVEKLPLLQPWITRYHLSMTRVKILPGLILLLCFSQSWAVGVILLVAGPLIPVFMALVGMAAEEASRRQLTELGSLNEMLMERLAAMLDIRLLGASESVAEEFESRAERLRESTMEVLRIAFLSSTVLELFAALGVALVAVFVGFSLLGEIGFGTWGSPLTIGQGVFLLLLAPEYFQPLRELAAAWHDRAAGLSVVAELDVLDQAAPVPMLGAGALVAPLPGAFSIKTHGAVAALPGQAVALPDIVLEPGQNLALTGPSGAGKTTSLKALAGLLPLQAGEIEVCGQPLSEASADAWRARIALMPQKPHFSDQPLGTWLDPRGSGSDPQSALALAQAAEIVAALPAGLKTRLGESGGGVSGGEARRLMLARALHAGGDVILADEPTADLDPETADLIRGALLGLKARGIALIVATHDPALAAAMDHQIELRS